MTRQTGTMTFFFLFPNVIRQLYSSLTHRPKETIYFKNTAKSLTEIIFSVRLNILLNKILNMKKIWQKINLAEIFRNMRFHLSTKPSHEELICY